MKRQDFHFGKEELQTAITATKIDFVREHFMTRVTGRLSQTEEKNTYKQNIVLMSLMCKIHWLHYRKIYCIRISLKY